MENTRRSFLKKMTAAGIGTAGLALSSNAAATVTTETSAEKKKKPAGKDDGKLRFGFIGTGSRCHEHINNVLSIPGNKIVAICDIQAGKCTVEYEKNEHIVQPIPNGERTILDGEKTITLTRELFDYDVIMKDHPASKAVTLKKSDGGFVKLSFPHSDCIAVWTSTGNPDAQFICLEPWTSVPVYEDDAFEDIENKPHAIKLAPEAVYTYSYTVEVG